MNIQIAEPNLENPLEQFKPEIATSTREALASIFPIGETAADSGFEPVSKDVLTGLKERVNTRCTMHLMGGYAGKPADTFQHVQRVLYTAGQVLESLRVGANELHYSYYFEYTVRWAKGYLYKQGLPLPEEYGVLSTAVQKAPRGTCGYIDEFVGAQGLSLGGLLCWAPTLPVRLLEKLGIARSRTQVVLPTGQEGEVIISAGGFLGVVYTLEGTVWFAGFLNNEDFLKLNFRRMRLGAAVKELTNDSEVARKAVDAARTSEFDFVLYPNDVPFGEVYYSMRNTVHSCMSGSVDNYRAPFDVHPCDVYSTAHYGQGDNGLVLVQASKDGKPVGRGILNVQTRTIVRWYGEHDARTLLANTFSIEQDSDALDGVRLALIQDGCRIAAPYLDGNEESVGLDDGYLVVGIRDVRCDDTTGYRYLGSTQECCISGDTYLEEDMYYQDASETWYHPDNTDGAVECAVTGEYFARYDTSPHTIDGEDVHVWDGVSLDGYAYGYEYLNDTIGWTKDTDAYRYDEESDEWYTEDDYEELLATRAEAKEEEEDAA